MWYLRYSEYECTDKNIELNELTDEDANKQDIKKHLNLISNTVINNQLYQLISSEPAVSNLSYDSNNYSHPNRPYPTVPKRRYSTSKFSTIFYCKKSKKP